MKKIILSLMLFSQIAVSSPLDNDIDIATAATLVSICQTLRNMMRFQIEVGVEGGEQFTVLFAKHTATKWGYESVADMDKNCILLSKTLPQPPKEQ